MSPNTHSFKLVRKKPIRFKKACWSPQCLGRQGKKVSRLWYSSLPASMCLWILNQWGTIAQKNQYVISPQTLPGPPCLFAPRREQHSSNLRHSTENHKCGNHAGPFKLWYAPNLKYPCLRLTLTVTVELLLSTESHKDRSSGNNLNTSWAKGLHCFTYSLWKVGQALLNANLLHLSGVQKAESSSESFHS